MADFARYPSPHTHTQIKMQTTTLCKRHPKNEKINQKVFTQFELSSQEKDADRDEVNYT